VSINFTQRTGLYADWELAFRLTGPLPIENILMKLITKFQSSLPITNDDSDKMQKLSLFSPNFAKHHVACWLSQLNSSNLSKCRV
jgi:hypothetical protein